MIVGLSYNRALKGESHASRRAGAILLLFLAAALPGRPATFEELAAQASSARAANNFPQAIDLYRQAVQIKPDWQDGWWFLGTLLYDSNAYADGRDAFSQFVKLDRTAGRGWAFLGLCEFETGAYPAALEHIQQGLTLGTGMPPASEEVLRFHLGLLLTRAGFYDQGRRTLRPFVLRRNHDPLLLLGIGINALQRPLTPAEVPPAQQPLLTAAGQTVSAWMTGDTGATEAGFRTLLEKYPNEPGVHDLYAVYLSEAQPQAAIAELHRELEVNPSHAEARPLLALLLLRQHDAPAALPFAKKAAEDRPATPMAQYAYGVVLTATGDLRQAIEHLEVANRLDPANLETHLALVAAYSQAGRHEDARRERKLSIQMAGKSDTNGSN